MITSKMYIENTFLYAEHDLSKNTIKEVMLDDAKVSDATIAQTGSAKYATATGDISFVEDVADYYTYIRASQNIQRYNFEYAIHVTDTIVNEDHATVQLFTEVSFQYTPEDEMTYFGDYYTVELLRVNNNWYIADMTSDGMEADGLSKQTFDYRDAVAQFDSYYADLDSTVDSEQLEATDTFDEGVKQNSTTPVIDYSRTYNRTNAIAYANTYSSANYTAATGNNPAYMNNLFYDYTNYGGNCQNFVSQAVWAGFGASNTAASVDSVEFPMDINGTNIWYHKSYNARENWTGVNEFYAYFQRSNSDNDNIGMKGNAYTINPGNDFSSVTTNKTSLLGAVLHVNYSGEKQYGNDKYGHAILLTDASGLSFDKVKYCGNSPMRRQVLLSDSSYVYNKQLRLIVPTTMRRIKRCDSGNHDFPAATSGGTPYTCRKCGFCKLAVTPNMRVPMKVGSATISGSVNLTCFRMAIGITSPSGKTTWKEFTNTKNASTTYNFSEKGLYTIKLCGRDVDPDFAINSQNPVKSTNVMTVFTVRIW